MSIALADDGCRLYYEVTGEGEPVVLIPGLGGDGRFWRGVEKALNGLKIITIDHRGAGRSDRPDKGYSIQQIASDVVTVLDAERIDAAHLVGHSTGGTVVQTIALDAAERARSLVISGSWARSDARFRALFLSRLEMMRKGEVTAYQNLTHVFGYTPEWIAAHEAELLTAVTSAAENLIPYSVTAQRIAMLLDFDRSQELTAINQPTLLLGARDDIMIPYYHVEELHHLIAHSLIQEMQGGHFYPRVAPQEFADVVANFLGV
ncbi:MULTISPECIES: alpha/beta fold hydrolase [Brucella/Ochrobactrum group]|jgi:aminoacrylate hydrolase|uniref:alpha/beta fold hydrolase n=1 Tax=Brucella/Ochrobactrum group TaxID=2826938 RepID=UPI001C05C3AD|nr:alpha/beta hydrolase [Brucella sp. NBRC 12950]QWK80964.1 alpha/beta hydrolase [Ochrobactrum sp. BTU1]GLU27392.1 hydrolase [Brucella sp. NBRC 12950]